MYIIINICNNVSVQPCQHVFSPFTQEVGRTSLSLVHGKFVVEVGEDNYYLQYQVQPNVH